VPLPREGDWVVRAVPEALDPPWIDVPPLVDGALLVAPDPDPPALTEPDALPPADGVLLLPAEPEVLPLADGVLLLPAEPEVLPLTEGVLLVPVELEGAPDILPPDVPGLDVWARVPGVTDDPGGQS
jgi:hypothetical protein